jgi:hypothetical protein
MLEKSLLVSFHFFRCPSISINTITGAQESLMKARDERVALMNEASFNDFFFSLILNLGCLDPRWDPHAEGINLLSLDYRFCPNYHAVHGLGT